MLSLPCTHDPDDVPDSCDNFVNSYTHFLGRTVKHGSRIVPVYGSCRCCIGVGDQKNPVTVRLHIAEISNVLTLMMLLRESKGKVFTSVGWIFYLTLPSTTARTLGQSKANNN